MSQYLISTSIESGLIYALLALGVFISYRVMKIPDLTVDGSFTTGAAVSAIFTVNGMPYLGILVAFIAGIIAGSITAIMHTKLKISAVLAGILSMTGLYSINLAILNNQPNVMIKNSFETVFSPFKKLGLSGYAINIPPLIGIAVVVVFLIIFFKSTLGLSIRATGDNEIMVRSSSINTDYTKIIALSMSNGFAALCGAFLTQKKFSYDITMGGGMIVTGLASLILGEVIIGGKKSVTRNLIAAVVGAIIYQLITAFVISANIPSSYLKLISALIVVVAVSYPTLKEKIKNRKEQRRRLKNHA